MSYYTSRGVIMRGKNTTENFNWREFKLYTSQTNQDMAELLDIKIPHMSMMVRSNWVTMPVKKKLDNLFGQDKVNKFLIGACFEKVA